MTGTPWGELLLAALRLGLSPDAFWRLGLKEWRLMCASRGAGDALGRVELEALSRRFPDGGEWHGDVPKT